MSYQFSFLFLFFIKFFYFLLLAYACNWKNSRKKRKEKEKTHQIVFKKFSVRDNLISFLCLISFHFCFCFLLLAYACNWATAGGRSRAAFQKRPHFVRYQQYIPNINSHHWHTYAHIHSHFHKYASICSAICWSYIHLLTHYPHPMHTYTHYSNRANGFLSYGDMIIILTYTHTLTLFKQSQWPFKLLRYDNHRTITHSNSRSHNLHAHARICIRTQHKSQFTTNHHLIGGTLPHERDIKGILRLYPY